MDSRSIYVVGYESEPYIWRIEKRSRATGALDDTFGSGTGVVNSNPHQDIDSYHYAKDIAIDGTYMYVMGGSARLRRIGGAD